VQQLEEVSLVRGQVLIGEQLKKVAEIVAGVEAQPLDVVHQNDAGAHQQLGELNGIDAVLLVLLELNARVLQQVDRVLRIHVLARETKDDACITP